MQSFSSVLGYLFTNEQPKPERYEDRCQSGGFHKHRRVLGRVDSKWIAASAAAETKLQLKDFWESLKIEDRGPQQRCV